MESVESLSKIVILHFFQYIRNTSVSEVFSSLGFLTAKHRWSLGDYLIMFYDFLICELRFGWCALEPAQLEIKYRDS